MIEVGPIGPMPPPTVARMSQVASATAFVVRADSTPPGAAEPLSGVAGLSGLLALQESESVPIRDRDARRRGRDILAALGALQRGLLGGADPDGATVRLAALLAEPSVAADPGLNAILSAIRLRARIELARRHMTT
ncbi:MAG: flagellar assembly protein FliX [Acetobacteraceae bacterium]